MLKFYNRERHIFITKTITAMIGVRSPATSASQHHDSSSIMAGSGSRQDPKSGNYTAYVNVVGRPSVFETAHLGFTMSWVNMLPIQQLFSIQQASTQRPLTADELAIMRKELEKMLANGKCKEFIDKLVSFNTGQPFDSRTLLDYFDGTIKSVEGGIFFSPGNGGISRYNRKDYPKVFIGDAPPTKITPPALSAYYHAAATTLLHELIHAVTYGADNRLSSQIQKLGIVPIYNGKPLSPRQDNLMVSLIMIIVDIGG